MANNGALYGIIGALGVVVVAGGLYIAKQNGAFDSSTISTMTAPATVPVPAPAPAPQTTAPKPAPVPPPPPTAQLNQLQLLVADARRAITRGDFAAADRALVQAERIDPRSAEVSAARRDLRDEFRAYTSTDENSDRVGECAIGTNIACTRVIGNILQDEKIPGIHIAFGHPYAEHTGAKWVSKTHIDCVGRDFDIFFDGEPIMRGGKFVF